MDALGEELLPRAVFSVNQHGAFETRDGLCPFDQSLHGSIFGFDIVKVVGRHQALLRQLHTDSMF